jgi:tetratricopeptide (TPR) repeat protein
MPEPEESRGAIPLYQVLVEEFKHQYPDPKVTIPLADVEARRGFWETEYESVLDPRRATHLGGTDPNDAVAWQNLGADCIFRSEYEKTEECYRKTLQLDSEAGHCSGLGYLLMIRGDCSSAGEAFEAPIIADETLPNSFYLILSDGMHHVPETPLGGGLIMGTKGGQPYLLKNSPRNRLTWACEDT